MGAGEPDSEDDECDIVLNLPRRKTRANVQPNTVQPLEDSSSRHSVPEENPSRLAEVDLQMDAGASLVENRGGR